MVEESEKKIRRAMKIKDFINMKVYLYAVIGRTKNL